MALISWGGTENEMKKRLDQPRSCDYRRLFRTSVPKAMNHHRFQHEGHRHSQNCLHILCCEAQGKSSAIGDSLCYYDYTFLVLLYTSIPSKQSVSG